MPLPVTQVVIDMLSLDQSGVAVAGATNSVDARQSEAVTFSLFFRPLTPRYNYPTTPTQGHFVLPSRDQDDGPVELNDQHLQSQGKIGDCEQSRITTDINSKDFRAKIIEQRRERATLTNTTR